MTPITKNIRVVDESGKEYEATYPKRARGLVKNGRARFVDENCICLVRPPNNDLEEHEMSDIHTPKEASALNAEINETLQNDLNAAAGDSSRTNESNSPMYTLEWVLSRIDKIIGDTKHISSAMGQLAAMDTDGTSGDIGSAGKAEAIGNVVKCRETTNQQTLRLLEKMYDDLKPPKASGPFALSKFEGMKDLVENLPPVQKENILRALADLPQNENAAPRAPLHQLRKILDELRSTDWNGIDGVMKEAIADGIRAQLSRNW